MEFVKVRKIYEFKVKVLVRIEVKLIFKEQWDMKPIKKQKYRKVLKNVSRSGVCAWLGSWSGWKSYTSSGSGKRTWMKSRSGKREYAWSLF